MTSLVPYGSSGEESDADDEEVKHEKKKRKLPPFLPQKTEGDDGVEGQKKQVQTSLGVSDAVLKGDWLCYAFIDVNQRTGVHEIVLDALALLQSECSKVKAVPDVHISLTKPILVRYHDRDDVVRKAREAVSENVKATHERRFPVAFSAFTQLPSEDRSRIFFAIEVGLGWQELRSLTTCLDEKISSMQARPYFTEARFHASFAFVDAGLVGQDEREKWTASMERRLGERLRSCPPLLVEQLIVATGSRLQQIKFDAE